MSIEVFQNYDKRQEFLKQYLFEEPIISGDNILVLPIQGIDKNGKIFGSDIDFCEYVGENNFSLVITGKKTLLFENIIEKFGIKSYSYLEDLQFQLINTILSVEGSISDLIANTDFSLYNAKVLILGYGKIGKILSKHLKKMGSEIVIACRDQKDIISAYMNEYKVVNINDISNKCLSTVNIIVNTIPVNILTDNQLTKINNSCYFLDVASKPGALLSEQNKQIKFKFKQLLGIPGLYSPKSAAKAIYSSLKTFLRGGV